MYVKNLKQDFYEFLAAKRILLIANYDIDSICTCKILQPLLKQEYCVYTLEVVKNTDDLKRVYHENCDDVKYFVLINCGGTVDILECLEPEEDVLFFILDAHRPTDVYNIYSDNQVRLLCSQESDVNVPKFHDIFTEDDESENEEHESEKEDSDEVEDRAVKRQRLEERIIRRREKRIWEQNREEILRKYAQYTYYAYPSAITMFNLAWKLSKDDMDFLWYAIVALAEQEVLGKIEDSNYVLETGTLQSHANRLRNRTADNNLATSTKIEFEKDLRLALYRHWTVESSLKYSTYTACKLKLWSIKGEMKLHELLVDMGLPLVQSKQNFSSMDLDLRQEFLSKLEKFSEKYGLTDIIYSTFTLSYGYRNKFTASDYVYALIAILDASSSDKNPQECFHLALDCLSRTKKEVLHSALERAKNIITTLFKTVQNALDMKRVISAGPFLYYIIQEGSTGWQLLSQPNILFMLAQFLLKAYVSTSSNRKAQSLPLLVSAPSDADKGTCILLGVPPLCEDSTKNLFGEAFQQIASNINCDTFANYFDTSYVDLHIKDRTRFLDALTAIVL
ncbi:cell division control protein 45 homolog [Agrilus planipennis]|uniref:Cell division control protein 45 homolog n=1 Tax=Agrilus planipennis TaxID=224129 RepID=A0A1W4X9Z5_AGRPL|nr:cell division control protein 45 homolog [Agrilus planipennis]